ncbi:MAG: hypothetical protein IPG45_08300 [Deltaproteobacteria bacterium]|nr:hypothetical protein [Deltaproteobacteria bacterium]
MRALAFTALFVFFACSSAEDDPPNDAGVVTCEAPTQGPTVHSGFPNADETWSAAGSPHRVTSDLVIGPTIIVTIEPCAVVELSEGVFLRAQGRLYARGVEGRPITFRAAEGARWASLAIQSGARVELSHVELSGGGQIPATSFGETIEVVGGVFPPVPQLLVQNVTVRGSAGYGLYLRNWAAFDPTSRDLTVQGSGAVDGEPGQPMRISYNALGSIPSGRYTGNRADEIVISGDSPHYQVELDDTLRNRGVPYHVGDPGNPGRLEIVQAKLTIEAGVTLRFSSTPSGVGGLDVRDQGVLVAVGSSAAPIVFTSLADQPGPGAWEGVTFTEALGAGNQLQQLRIENAGAHGGDNGFGCPPLVPTLGTDAALKFFTQLPSDFVDQVDIVDSAVHGIIEAWNGTYVDLLSGNTFSGVSACNLVSPKDAEGNCPADPPCPK